MSDRVGLKPKDNAAKKFSSLNLNQTYKGTKVEAKASTGIPRHGLQSLGKVATSRRMPPPANLPSLKSENLGNDPTVALVPSGGGGWGSGKEKEANTTTTTNKNASQGQPAAAQPQAQQPSKATDASQKPATAQQANTGQTTSTNQTSATTKTWASSSSSVAGGQEKTSYPHQSQYFNREFPTLGGGNSKDRLPEERASHQPYGQPPRNMHEPPWMDKGGPGPPPPKPAFGMYNGAPYPGPPQRSNYGQMHHRDGHPPNNHSQDFPYMGQSRPANYATHPAANQRGHPGTRVTGSMPPKHMIKLEDSPSGYVRPSIVNEEDIRAMDAEDVEDGGWAGAQEEIDYSVKLNFDDDEAPSAGDHGGKSSGRETKQADHVSEPPQHQGERVVNGQTNKAQVDARRPPEPPRQAWAIPSDGHNNFQPQWNESHKQAPYNIHGYNAQRQWAGHFPQAQQRHAYPLGTSRGPSGPGVRQQTEDQNRAGTTNANKPPNERSAAIEQARQRKQMEEEERKRQTEAAAHEKLRLLNARTRPVQIQTQDASVREQAGPRSPVSPAGSDTQVRRIMRRKDSGSVGDDDGSSVKSVESVGKEEKKVSGENQINKSVKERKTSSSDQHEEGKSSSIQKNEDERTVHPEREKVECKSSVTKYPKEIVEKPKGTKDLPRTESQNKNREEGKEAGKVSTTVGRDVKKQVEDAGKRPERKSSESRPRSDEAVRKKSQSVAEESRNRNDYESRKENLERGGDRLGSKSDRGSTEKRKEDRRRPDDIKRKREDFERNDVHLNERNSHASNRGRLYPGRGRGTLGGKSHLRGHPKSYSNARTDRTATQRRPRNDSKDYAVDDIKTVAAEEKGQVNERVEEGRWADGDGNRRQGEGNKRQPYGDRRQRDDRRQHDDKQHFKTEKPRRDGDKRYVDGEKREREENKQQVNERRRNDYHDSRSYDSKHNERGTRDIRDDRSYKSTGRYPSKGPTDRAERYRDKSKNKGGFGVPPAKEQPKKSESEEKSKDETTDVVKAVPSTTTTDSKKSNDKETISLNKGKTNESSSVPPTTKDWDVESRDAKKEFAAAAMQKNVAETKTEKPAATTKDASADKNVSEKVHPEKTISSITDVKKQQDNKEGKASADTPSKNETKSGERRERIVSNKENREQNKARISSKNDSGDTKGEKKHDSDNYGENRRRQDSKFDDRRTRPREEMGREPSKRNDDRKPVRSSSENWEKEIESRPEVRKEATGTQSIIDGKRIQRENRKDRRDQRDQEKSDYRYKNERNRNDQRERTDRRDGTEQRDRRDRTDQRDRRDRIQRERPDRRDRTEQIEGANQRDRLRPAEREKVESNENRCDKPRKPDSKEDEQSKVIQQTESLPEKQGANKVSGRTEKQDENLNTMKKQSDRFTVGTVSPASGRRRFNDTRRGAPSSRRGSRGGLRGRGRISGKVLERPRTASRDDDENDSEDYHSANSSVYSDGSDSEDEDRRKNERGQTRFYSSSGRSRGTYSSRGRGRGRGSSQLNRSPRKVETPPRFQRQAKSTSRSRGKSNRGGFSSKENWDDNISKSKDSRNSDEGPLPKKRPQDISYSKEKDSDGGLRGRKTTRGGHSGSKSSFLAKKQQEAVEGSSRKGGGRFGAKPTIPAALTTQGRRAKNEPAPADGEENLEPPKKNPRRTEPQKVGIDHIDLSNIAGFIDIDDIAQPASEVEPASPQSDFVEVKSKRMQKEQRERAREEEERKRREIEKMMQDAMVKPKTNKSGSQNKQHSTSRPPRFARNSGVPPNVVSNLSAGNTSPRGATPVASPENGTITAISSTNVDQKRASPLMLEKPSSPPPPPMFNAWTKPLSITPAKPPGEASAELSKFVHPDPLAVGSGKPQRAGGTQPKAEPELQIQLTLPDTFQAIPGERDIDAQSSESRMFSRVNETDVGESRGALTKKSDKSVGEQLDEKQADVVQSARPNAQKEERKLNAQNVKASEPGDKNSENDKRQPTGNNWKSPVRAPRFEKNVSGKRSTDSKKPKGDNHTKDTNGEPKSQPDVDKLKEKNDGRPRSSSRSRDVNKTQKAKPQVKTTKAQNSDENRDPNIERSSQEKTESEAQQQNINKRDSVELDVQSMSESLLDETPLGVHMVETSKAGSANASMVKIKTEDDIKMDFEMQEKMVAAKKAWEHSLSSSVSIQTSQWNAPVTDDKNTETSEVSVVDQIPRRSPEPEESSEPLATTPRLKKPTAGEQQNVCKVKPQQQQQPVKPLPVPSEVPVEYSTAPAVLESQVQPSYTVPPQQAAIYTSKPQYQYSFEQQALVPISHQYVQTDMSSIQRHHVSPVRPQNLQAASQSPPQRAGTYPQGQSVSTPSPLSHQPLMQDTYRPLMQTAALYPTNTYAGNQYFSIPVVRPAAPPQYPATISEDISNSMYPVPAPKSQNPSHGYETAVPAAQQVFLPVEQQSFPEYVQSQRSHPVGFYSGNANPGLGGIPTHVQKSVAFPPSEKSAQSQRDSRTPSGRQEQFTPPEQSEMSKHIHAKPFQPPTSHSGNAGHQIPANVRQVPTVSGHSVPPTYHVNNAVLTMQASSAAALQSSVSSSDHTGTSAIVSQAHALPVSRLSFQQFPAAVGSFPRQVQVPVQQLTAPNYPASIAYRTTVPNYATTTSVANQTAVLLHKPAPMMRQLVAAGRGTPVSHRMPEPIQRPSKAGFHLATSKEKQLNAQPRLKTVHQQPSRRAFNPITAAQAPMAAYQFQPLPGPQQTTQPQQQQQIFKKQQHQQMLSGVQQFFAEEKEIEHQRKQKQANQKREVGSTATSSGGGNTTTTTTTTTNQEIKPQKSKDEQQKKHRPQQLLDRSGVRTAQIPPRQARAPNKPKPTGPKRQPMQQPVQQLSGGTPPKTDTVNTATSLVT